jgi:hypothetical protein
MRGSPKQSPQQGTKTALAFYRSYYDWMRKVNHPDLAYSNHKANKFLEDSNMRGSIQLKQSTPP